MSDQKIEPHRITKPIQLLGAWLVGLVLTDSIFLGATLSLDSQSWERGALVIAAIVNVPLFLIALFLLQTKFRAELQEDTYYHEYLSKKSASIVRIDKDTMQDNRLSEIEKRVSQLIDSTLSAPPKRPESEVEPLDWHNWPVGINYQHPNYKDIKKTLRSCRIPVTSVFGNKNNSPIPDKWVISLSPELPIGHKAQILKTVLPYGFDGIELYAPMREIGESEDVYIGGYGKDGYSEITQELYELLETGFDEFDLSSYCQQNLANT